MSDTHPDQTDVQPPRAEEPAADAPPPEAPDAAGSEPEAVEPDEVLAPETLEPDEVLAPVVAGPEETGADAGEDGAIDDADAELAEPEDELTRAQRERGEYLALAQRTQADFENYRKRAAKETAAAGRRARSGLIGELLSVVDNLERALASAGQGEEHLADGVRLVHSELISVLARNGVEQFDPAGQKFDPSFHEALSTREADGAEPGVVLDVVEKGYSLDQTVLRPARVVVSA